MIEPLIALVGRPNVGKSTLFNRLSRGHRALVQDFPGVTRDRHYGNAFLGDLSFRLVDTAGLFSLKRGDKGTLADQSHQQTQKAVVDATVLCFMVDGLEGLTSDDQEIARQLHKSEKPVILIINKTESKGARQKIEEFSALGFENIVAISAEHKEGFADLFEALSQFIEAPSSELEETPETVPQRPINLTVIGRPNVGKSTFINCVLGQERLVTSEEAGTTRDAIEVPFSFKGNAFSLWDTAGLRRQSRIDSQLEKQSVEQTRHTVQYADCVILMLDATHPLEKQDLTLARQVEEEGRSMVIVLNKIDKIKNPENLIKEISREAERLLSQMEGISIVPISSLKKTNVAAVFDAVMDVYKVWNKRLGTSPLNRWLEDVLDQNPPPLVGGRALKIRYVTQIKARPPTFAFFSSRAQEFPESYLRYLRNHLRRSFSLWGVPLRLVLRQSKNPYQKT